MPPGLIVPEQELGWDGSLMNCKSPGHIVPSLAGQVLRADSLLDARFAEKGPESPLSGGPISRRNRAEYWLIGYQTRQEFCGYIGCPCLQLKALPNSSKFCTEPFTRHFPGECGSLSAAWRE
jgi:hypothetical protein